MKIVDLVAGEDLMPLPRRDAVGFIIDGVQTAMRVDHQMIVTLAVICCGVRETLNRFVYLVRRRRTIPACGDIAPVVDIDEMSHNVAAIGCGGEVGRGEPGGHGPGDGTERRRRG